MNRPFLPLAFVAFFSVLGPALAQPTADAPKPQPAALEAPTSVLLDAQGAWRQGRSRAVLALLDEQVEAILRADPVEAGQRGDERYNDQLPDPSPAAVERRVREAADRLQRARAIESGNLSEADALDLSLLIYELEQRLDAAKYHPEQTPIDSRSGPQIGLAQMCDSLPFKTARQYADYAARLEKIPILLDSTIEELRAGMAAKRVPPRVSMTGVAEQCALLASDDIKDSPSLSPFYKPFRGVVGNEPAAERARRAISTLIAPAFGKLGNFLRNEYIPACRESVAYSQGIDGPAAYDSALRRNTTTRLTADEIHAIGEREVARIHEEMMGVIARTDFPGKDKLKGDELFRAFTDYLRTDRRFYCTTSDELLAGYRAICKRIDAGLPRLFGRLPRLSYGVRELSPLVAETSPTAYYYSGSMKAGVPGWFMCNTWQPNQRPKYEMIPLALHEAVPGHHLQGALANEIEGQHAIHSFTGYNAFLEGWGLYAESLGLEIDDTDGADTPEAAPADGSPPVRRTLYADPYNDFGRLNYEMWRACRLVVDTGIHAKGWTRQRAIDYMLANTALSPLNIEREVDRYISWPGQACAYKLGELKIKELRARAERALGDRFNIRTFHDTVLSSGCIPLPALEAKIDRWIVGQNPDARH